MKFRSELPTHVPLPEVENYTDHVVFGNMNLPVGFDEERLLVNLRAFRRVQRVAGLGQMVTQVEMSSGKRVSASGKVEFPTFRHDFDLPATELCLRLPQAPRPAVTLNKGLKLALREASVTANADVPRLVVAGALYALPMFYDGLSPGIVAAIASGYALDRIGWRASSEGWAEALRSFRYSAVAGVKLDRIVAAQALISAQRFVKFRE